MKTEEQIEQKRQKLLEVMHEADNRTDLEEGRVSLVGAPAQAMSDLEYEKNPGDTIFEAKHLNLWYDDDHQALHDINIKIFKNKVTAFIGPSGCGKSTFLRCFDRMNDLIEGCKIKGELLFNGVDIKTINPILLRSRVGMVFQQPNPFPMSIAKNITYGPRCQGIKDRKYLRQLVNDSLEEAALYNEVKDRLNSSGMALSGGQQQRLCIARTVAMHPDVILMDEPTSALDPIATKKIEDLIQKLKKKYTIIIVTHNMQQATRVADYTAFFVLGKLIEFAPTAQFFSHPKEKESEDYITGRFS